MADYKLKSNSMTRLDWEEAAERGCVDLAVEAPDGVVLWIAFYDPTRLRQTIADDLRTQGCFGEANVAVVNEVTEENVERAVKILGEAGHFSDAMRARGM
jgi:hypothetical protein